MSGGKELMAKRARGMRCVRAPGEAAAEGAARARKGAGDRGGGKAGGSGEGGAAGKGALRQGRRARWC